MATWTLRTLPDLTDAEYEKWQVLLEERTGISFERHRRILQSGLAQRLREIDCPDYEEYYRRVSNGRGAAVEWSALLRTLTVKETRFQRDPDALDFVRRYLYNQLVKQHHRGSALELWSVACSTGEEAYSLAMLANECIESSGQDKFFGVTATDICLSSLAKARKGLYPNRRLETLDKRLQDRYFEPGDRNQSAVVSWLKQRVCFVQANLIDMENLPVKNMDVIYCQNVLIYFKRWRQRAVLDELVERLKPNGLLIVGMGEAVDWRNEKVERVKEDGVQAYIKVA